MLFSDPAVRLLVRDGAGGAGSFGQSGEQGQHRRSGEHAGVHLDRRIVEAGIQQQVAVLAGGARASGQVCAGVDDGAGEGRIGGVDDDGVPVLAEQHDPPSGLRTLRASVNARSGSASSWNTLSAR